MLLKHEIVVSVRFDMSNLSKRILSALVLIPFALALVFISSINVFIIGISLISALAAYEFCYFCASSEMKRLSVFSAVSSGLLSFGIAFFPFQSSLILYFLPAIVLLLFLSVMFLDKPVETAVRFLSFSFFGAFYVGILMGFLGLIASSSTDSISGRYAVFLLVLGTFLGDTGAYTAGRIFGKHKLSPKLSPKKTWEGAAGGFAATTASVFLVRFFMLPGITILVAVLLSFLLSVSCQIGDLAESFIKRGVGVKDSGSLIPGHGGILDRIDALLFGAPVVYFFSLFF